MKPLGIVGLMILNTVTHEYIIEPDDSKLEGDWSKKFPHLENKMPYTNTKIVELLDSQKTKDGHFYQIENNKITIYIPVGVVGDISFNDIAKSQMAYTIVVKYVSGEYPGLPNK